MIHRKQRDDPPAEAGGSSLWRARGKEGWDRGWDRGRFLAPPDPAQWNHHPLRGDLIRPSVRTGAPSALPRLPFAGLLRNDPPTARLRKLRPRFFLRLAVPEKPFGLTLPALPHFLFAGRHYDLPANSAAAEIAASLLLPPAARGRNSSGFSTAAVKEPRLLLPQAAAGLFPTGSARPQFPVRGEGFVAPQGRVVAHGVFCAAGNSPFRVILRRRSRRRISKASSQFELRK